MKFIKKYNESVDSHDKPDIDLINDILVYLKDEGFLTHVDTIYDSKNIGYIDISISLPPNPSKSINYMNRSEVEDYIKSVSEKKPMNKGRYSKNTYVFFKLDEVIDTIKTLILFLDIEYNYKLYYIDLRPEIDNLSQDEDTKFLDVVDNNIDELYKYEYYQSISLTFKYQ